MDQARDDTTLLVPDILYRLPLRAAMARVFEAIATRHATNHGRTSSCCRAEHPRILRRFLEYGERAPYVERLEV